MKPRTTLGLGLVLLTCNAGKQADIIAVPGDPLEDITVMERVSFVKKAGRIYKND